MDKPYLLKVLLCEAVDRLEQLNYLVEHLPTLSDDKLLRVLKQADHMMQVVNDASEKWRDHCLRCASSRSLAEDEAVKRGLLEP